MSLRLLSALGAACLGLGLIANVAAQDIKLPTMQPDLEVTEQAALGTVSQGLKAGEQLPEFKAKAHTGEPVESVRVLEQAPVLVVFYRGGWCPYCNVQIRQLTEAFPEFRKRGVTPVVISADKPDASAMAQATYEIPFPVLSDPDLQAHEAFGVVIQIDEATAKRYRDYGIVLEDWSGRDHHKIAAPGIFLVDATGKVLWSHVADDYKTRPSVEQLLAVLDAQQ